MFGKAFASMYEGSMIGRGAVFFAVWGYVIANFAPDRKHGAIVELNPTLIAFVLGESVKDVEAAIEEMLKPDAKSRTKAEKGRKLIRLSEYQYRVVNGEMYRAIRNQDERKRQNREAQERFREKQKFLQSSRPTPNEAAYLKAERSGATQEELDEIAAQGTK